LIGKTSGSAKKTKPPAGWKEFSYPGDGFKAYMPREPSIENTPHGIPGAGPLIGARSATLYMSGEAGEPIQTMGSVVRLHDGLRPEDRERLVGQLARGIEQAASRGIQRRTVRWVGRDAEELAGDEGLVRILATDTAVYVAGILARASGPRVSTRAT